MTTSITCAHCGRMFQITYSSGDGHFTKNHSPSGCGKNTRIWINQGNIVRTDKA